MFRFLRIRCTDGAGHRPGRTKKPGPGQEDHLGPRSSRTEIREIPPTIYNCRGGNTDKRYGSLQLRFAIKLGGGCRDRHGGAQIKAQAQGNDRTPT